jgi:hypothetical protein
VYNYFSVFDTAWSDSSAAASDYAVPERFTVMRRSPAGLLPILPRYHKRSVGLDEAAARGRWGAIAPQRKRFVLAKRSPPTTQVSGHETGTGFN